MSSRPSVQRSRRRAPRSRDRLPRDPATSAATLAEIHASVERARHYAVLWLRMRDEILRSLDEPDDDASDTAAPTFGVGG